MYDLKLFEIIILMVSLELKHLICDFYLQMPFEYMWKNKGRSVNWFWPLFFHSSVNAFGLLVVFVVFTYTFYQLTLDLLLTIVILSLIDLFSHFMVDRWKAIQPYNIYRTEFWINVGVDQAAHKIINISLAFYLLLDLNNFVQ